jgi:hypothetical protein
MVSSTASASHLFPGFLFHEAFAETGSQKSPARDVPTRPSPMPGRNRMMADALCPEVFWRYLKIFRSECGRVPTIKLGRIAGFRMFASTETAKLEHRRNRLVVRVPCCDRHSLIENVTIVPRSIRAPSWKFTARGGNVS